MNYLLSLTDSNFTSEATEEKGWTFDSAGLVMARRRERLITLTLTMNWREKLLSVNLSREFTEKKKLQNLYITKEQMNF